MQRAKRSLTKDIPEGIGGIPSMDGVGVADEKGHPVAHDKNENYYWYIRRDPFDPQWVRNVWAIAFWAFVGDMSLQVCRNTLIDQSESYRKFDFHAFSELQNSNFSSLKV